ncbi:Hypothetical protein HVPorG_05053 (plasmid) [Roseomonas mucosa]|uniref:hypothetical protein n=1 Tax=Roseomonas mucosa TaxID=207340 RepID=UPI002201E3E2|nr:hypothetical protein [Roseomonas mucosa]QDJ12281.1 Hypothetical protein HVPorG_05053 [Roseomonas mucosa]
MAKYSMRLVQRTTEQGSGDFVIEAATPEGAAAVLSDAYKAACAEDSSIIKLADGQSQVIERTEVLGREVSFVLLDEHGDEVRTVTPPNGHAA